MPTDRDVDGSPSTGFLQVPDTTAEVQAMYDSDVAGDGYVMNLTRVWAHDPAAANAFFGLVGAAVRPAALTPRQRGVLVSACASAIGDSYCSLAWGTLLAHEAGPDVARAVLCGDEVALDEQDRVLAAWARKVARQPNTTTEADVQALRDAGLSDGQIFSITLFVALRLAFSSLNDALGVRPDAQLAMGAPPEVQDAVTFGRRPATEG